MYFLLATSVVGMAIPINNSPPIKLYPNVNNVIGRAPYKANAGVVHYLGSFIALHQCECVHLIDYIKSAFQACGTSLSLDGDTLFWFAPPNAGRPCCPLFSLSLFSF